MIILGGLGQWEIIGIVIVILILFGGKKIPELMRGLGKGVREFNSARAQVKDELEKGLEDEDSTENNQ